MNNMGVCVGVCVCVCVWAGGGGGGGETAQWEINISTLFFSFFSFPNYSLNKINTTWNHQLKADRKSASIIDPDKYPFSAKNCKYFSYFTMKTYAVGTH